jgi:hypothetical protein
VDHRIETSRVEVQAAFEGERGRWPFGVVNRVVSQKDVAGRGHSLGEFVMSSGPLVS